MVSKVYFEIAPPEKIVEFVYDLRDTLDKSKLDQREGSPCIFVEFEPELKKELFYAKKLNPKLKEKLIHKIDEKMSSEREGMGEFMKEVKLKWEEVEKTFFNEMNKFFELGCERDFYCYVNNCVVSSYFGNNEISLIYFREINKNVDKEKKKELVEEATSIIAEEILHLLYFDYIRSVFNKNFTFDEIFDLGDDNYSGWHLTEIIPEYLLFNNPVFEKFGWNKINREKQGYFWIPKIKKKLDPLWQKRKSFKDFLIKAHKGVT